MPFTENSSPESLKEVSVWIVDVLRRKLCNEDGLLIQGIADGKIISNLIIDDFGDVAPFISIYGGEDICLRHLKYISEHYKDLGFTKAFAYTDLILGLVWYSRIGKYKAESLDLAIKLAGEVEKNWMNKNGQIFSLSVGGFKLPLTYGIDSTFIEIWTELYRETKDKKYSELAEKTFKYFSSIQAVSKEKVIPARYSSSNLFLPIKLLKKELFIEIHVMKDNTNYLFGLLDMIRMDICVGEVRRSFDEVFSTLSAYAKKNKLNNYLTPDDSSALLSSFAFIDLACDAIMLFKDELYLKSAVNLADNWLSLPSNKTGLFPRYFNSNQSYFDSETDMAVAFLKLYECTNEEKYLLKAKELLFGILNYHKTEAGFFLCVDLDTGIMTVDSIKTKFVALFIKLLHLCSEPGKIYKDPILFMLAKDR